MSVSYVELTAEAAQADARESGQNNDPADHDWPYTFESARNQIWTFDKYSVLEKYIYYTTHLLWCPLGLWGVVKAEKFLEQE